jgi:hypothetical protein
MSGVRSRVVISVSGGFLLALAALVFLNASATLSREDAQARIRQVLQREVLQRQALSAGGMTAEKAEALARALAAVKSIEISSLETGKLAPDYVLRPHRPTHIVRAEMRGPGGPARVRYFWLPWDGIDRETGATAWHFSF